MVIAASFCIYTALLFILLPIEWTISWLIAAGFHELSHLFVLRLYGINVEHVVLSWSGAYMYVSAPERIIAICAATGPAAGMLLTCFSNTFPRLAICGLIQSIFNLLPVYPSDGSRILISILKKWLPEPLAMRIATIFSSFIVIFGILLSAVKVGKRMILPLVCIAVFFLIRYLAGRKRPCKDACLGVQYINKIIKR